MSDTDPEQEKRFIPIEERPDKLKRFLRRKVHDYPRDIPPRMVIKGTTILMIGPSILLSVLFLQGMLDFQTTILSGAFLFLMSLIFILPYISNLSALTNYVRALSQNQDAEAPDLSFLNNVEMLQEAVEALHDTWGKKQDQLEALVRESQILINSLPDILIMLDKNLNVVHTNSIAKQVFGSLFYRETVERIIHEAEIEDVSKQVLNDNQGRDLFYVMNEPYMRHYIVRVEAFPRYSPSGIALILVMHDITKQKTTEQMLTDFVANASHEIRTPLTSVMGYIETLQTTAKDDPMMQEKFLDVMKQQSERIARLVKDLLSLSQIERTIYTKPHGYVHVGNLLKDIESHANGNGMSRGIKVVLDIKERLLPQIKGDAEQLRQVFDNVIGNALKYSRDNSTVTIEVDVVEGKYEGDSPLGGVEQLLMVAVHDEGDGIAQEHLERLTERFYRVDSARSRKVGGSGLGLSITKQILERHAGVLEIKSELGKGSTFSILLPIPEKEPKKKPKLRADELL